ncbi:MAG: (2Fe-2S)-binding protein [Candidatus Zixiibacteriota bacterium]
MKNKPIIVCRCEDITKKEIEDAIAEGFTDFEELKRYLRAGMGPCQGRTCGPMIRSMLAKAQNKSIEDVNIPTHRPPKSLLKFETISKYSEKEEK